MLGKWNTAKNKLVIMTAFHSWFFPTCFNIAKNKATRQSNSSKRPVLMFSREYNKCLKVKKDSDEALPGPNFWYRGTITSNPITDPTSQLFFKYSSLIRLPTYRHRTRDRTSRSMIPKIWPVV